MQAHFAARELAEMTDLLADDFSSYDRRRVINAGIRRGRDAAVQDAYANADIGVKDITTTVIATRGDRLVLSRGRYSGSAKQPESFHIEVLNVFELDADERVAALVIFDTDDFDAAIAELDARYVAGEGAAHAHTWSLIARAFAAINRHELPELTPDWVNIDHRRGAAFATGDMTAYLNDLLDHTPDIKVYIEVVHRLSNLGTVVTHAAHGTSQHGFQAEWREIGIFTFDGDLLGRYELFDDADVATAIAKFDQLSHPAPRLDNAASQLAERFLASFAARDWNAMVELLADDMSSDDRRAVIGAGIRLGPDAVTVEMRANADLWITKGTFTIVATRGERLALMHARFSGSDQEPQAFLTEVLAIGEINANERIVAIVAFDLDDFDAALAELDARYIAGEGAAHARTWSAIARAYASISGRELASTTPEWVNIDHRRAAAFAPGEAIAYIRAAWDLTKNLNIYAEAVYRLNDLGAVVAHAARGTSLEGFEAEWRAVNLFAVEGEKISRTELFDEADVDAVIARFDQLRSPAPRLENAGSQVHERFLASFAAHDWDAMGETLADDAFHDDRRRVVGGGLRLGRAAVIAEMSALAEIGVKRIASDIIATRGRHLILSRSHAAGHDQRPDAFRTDVLSIAEINGSERIVALATFDPDDFDAAIAELDARYLAGEAVAHAHTWSVITGTAAAFKRRELPATTPDWVNVDHRRATAFAPGDFLAYLRAAWDQLPDISFRIEAVHRLSNLGAVVTHYLHGTSQDGFEAEWREIHLMTIEGDLYNRSEVFDEADIDAALARFDELHPQTPRLENAASQVGERFLAHFAANDWDAMAEMLTDNFSQRRSPSGGGRGSPTWSRRLDRGHAVDRRPVDHGRDVGRHSDPRGAPRPPARSLLGPRSRPRPISQRLARHRRDQRRRADRGARHVRPRRHRRRYRGTRCPIPRRRSGRPRARVVGHRANLRLVQPARAPRDDAGLGDLRPPPRDTVRLQRPARDQPAPPPPGSSHLSTQHPHRSRASAGQCRSSRHQYGAWHLTRGLRRRVANDPTSDVEARPHQPMRDLRRSRPRRRTRPG